MKSMSSSAAHSHERKTASCKCVNRVRKSEKCTCKTTKTVRKVLASTLRRNCQQGPASVKMVYCKAKPGCLAVLLTNSTQNRTHSEIYPSTRNLKLGLHFKTNLKNRRTEKQKINHSKLLKKMIELNYLTRPNPSFKNPSL